MLSDSETSPSVDMQLLFFSKPITDPYLSHHHVEHEEEMDLSNVTLTHLITGKRMGGSNGETFMKFSSTDNVNDVNAVLSNGDFVKICRKEMGKLEWLTKKPFEKHLYKRIRPTDFTNIEHINESSTFKIYKVSSELKNTVYQLLEAHQKLQEYLNFLQDS
jgi:hypothetical protein